jgi:hypothetical protein
MKADSRFLNQPKSFWATVRLVSQIVGYTNRKTKKNPDSSVKVPTLGEIATALLSVGLDPAHVLKEPEVGNELGVLLCAYFEHRADVLNNSVKHLLMTKNQAEAEYERLRKELNPSRPVAMNKQKGAKKKPAYLTGIVDMLIEANLNGLECDHAPRQLTTITKDSVPLRTLARWVDGAFPSAVNPIAIWEIKEYYHTTTFGSRIADGVYETLLDGLELEELREHEGVEVLHYLFVDAYKTWWDDGRSYLCRMIDTLHMRYVDEILFGREAVARLPDLVREWIARAEVLSQAREGKSPCPSEEPEGQT